MIRRFNAFFSYLIFITYSGSSYLRGNKNIANIRIVFLRFLLLLGLWSLLSLSSSLYTQEYKRSSSLSYIDQLMHKIEPSLKRFIKKQNFQGQVAFTGLTGVSKDISASEKNYLTSSLEKLKFKKSEFRIITSIEAFNKTIAAQNRYRLDFETEKVEGARYAAEIDAEYYMLITLDFKKKTIGMDISIYSVRNIRRIWNERVSIYFDGRFFNYELGFLQSAGYDFSLFLSNLVYSNLTSFIKLGLYFAIGYSFINLNQTPQNIQKLRYIIGIKIAFSLLRSSNKEYNGLDVMLAIKGGLDGNFILGGGPLISETFASSILGTAGLNFFIKGRFSINIEVDIAKLTTGLIRNVPIQSSLLGFVEISYHF